MRPRRPLVHRRITRHATHIPIKQQLHRLALILNRKALQTNDVRRAVVVLTYLKLLPSAAVTLLFFLLLLTPCLLFVAVVFAILLILGKQIVQLFVVDLEVRHGAPERLPSGAHLFEKTRDGAWDDASLFVRFAACHRVGLR